MAESNYWTRFAARRLARRSFVQAGAAVGAGVALAACSSSNNNNKKAATTAPSATTAATRAATTTSGTTGVASPSAGGGVVSTARAGTAVASGAVANNSYGKADPKFQAHDTPKTRGGTWRLFSYDALPPDNLDPHQSSFGPMWGVWSAIFSKLLTFDDPNNQALAPDLAQSMPEQPDKLTYTFKLNPNAKWQSKTPLAPNNALAGKPVTSADVKFSLERQMNTKSPRAGNYPALLSFLTIDKVEAPDATTVKVTTKAPTAPFLAFVAGAFGSIISQTLVDQATDEMNSPDKLIGSGPFILTELTPLKVVRYAKNPDWHLKDSGFAPGRPFLDAIESTWIPQEDNSIEAAFKAKQVDYTQYSDQTNPVRIQKATPGTTLIPTPITGPVGGLLNNAKDPWKDKRVRQAVAIAMDRNALGNFIYQGSFRLNPPVSWGDVRWAMQQSDLLKKPGFRYTGSDRDADIKMAKDLLTAAGGPSIIPSSTTIIYSNTPAYIPAYFPQLQKNLQDVLGVQFQGHEDTTGYTEVIKVLLDHSFDFYWSYGNGVVDLDEWVYNGLHTGSPYNFAQISDPALDKLLDQQRQEFDYETRKNIGLQIQNMAIDNVYGTSMVALVDNFTAWNYVKNLAAPPWFQYNHLWANVWLDTTDPTWQGRPS